MGLPNFRCAECCRSCKWFDEDHEWGIEGICQVQLEDVRVSSDSVCDLYEMADDFYPETPQ